MSERPGVPSCSSTSRSSSIDRRALQRGRRRLSRQRVAFRRVLPCRARVRASRGERPSIIHAHDWQAGLVPVYQKMHFSPDPTIGGVPVDLHDPQPGVPGDLSTRSCRRIGFGPELLDIQALEYWGQISYLKGGINFSERLTTVSPTYAREILTRSSALGSTGSCAAGRTR